MSTIQILYVGNDTILEIDRLKNELTGAYLNSATVTVTLRDEAGAEVAGDTWPKTMAYLAGSNGVYRATLPHTLALTASQRVTAAISVDAGAGLVAAWDVECVARVRN